jgi:ferritin-like metal-binding protein YciE
MAGLCALAETGRQVLMGTRFALVAPDGARDPRAQATPNSGGSIMAIESLQDLYIEELKDIYSAENQIIKALPKMAAGANHANLKRSFEEHLVVTREQVKRLDTIFGELGEKPTGKHCKGMEGLIEEGRELLEEEADPDVRDAGLIGAAQKVEHYEMAAYGTVRTMAMQLGLTGHAELLQQTLDEEGETDKILTSLAESGVNKDAMIGRRNS